MQNEWIFSSPLPTDHFIKHFHLLSAASWQHRNLLEGTVMIWYFGWILNQSFDLSERDVAKQKPGGFGIHNHE